jgi:hypothetical protein
MAVTNVIAMSAYGVIAEVGRRARDMTLGGTLRIEAGVTSLTINDRFRCICSDHLTAQIAGKDMRIVAQLR